MAATLRIDTLKFSKRLADAGLSREAAEAIAEGLSEADISELATKTDIAEVKTAVADLRADIYNRLWLMGLGIVGLTVALMKILPRLIAGQSAATPIGQLTPVPPRPQ